MYVVISLLRAYTEYQQRLNLDQELRNQRDLYSRQSRVDPLTGLANRRQFGDVLEEAIALARRSRQPLSLFLLDIDHFKQINDSHGHTVGDTCLVIPAAPGEYLQPAGRAGRPGRRRGFGVILSRQDLVAAMRRAEAFRADLAAHPASLDGLCVSMTASVGVALFDAGRHPDMDAVYHAADSAVYLAKAGGHNRVCMYQPPSNLGDAPIQLELAAGGSG